MLQSCPRENDNPKQDSDHRVRHDPQLGLPADVLPDHPYLYDTVIIFFIDAFGWRFIREHGSNVASRSISYVHQLRLMMRNIIGQRVKEPWPRHPNA